MSYRLFLLAALLLITGTALASAQDTAQDTTPLMRHPTIKAEGEDPQLRRAVETLLQQIDRGADSPALEEDRK